MRLFDRIRYHIEKHRKKKLFASGARVCRCIFKIGIIIIIFLGISIIAIKPHVYEEKIGVYEAITSFYQIDDIAHQEMNETIKEGNPFDEGAIKEFNILDAEFHNATDINHQFKAAKKIVDFLTRQEVLHPYLGDTDLDLERDKKFTELLNIFNRVY